jgi:hypothetical protein
MLQRFNTNQFHIDRNAAELTLHEEASTLRMPIGPIFHTIELVSQRTGVVIELGLDMYDVMEQEKKHGEVQVFHYRNKANKIYVTIYND